MAVRGRGRTGAPRFSVVTIVRNEADRLPKLLASLGEFRARGGEVVVLDTGSKDQTLEVATQAGCRVASEPRRFNSRLTQTQARSINTSFSREGEGPFVQPGERLFNFGKARNWAAQMGRNDYQLAVDGGDVVEALDLDHIDAAIRDKTAVAYQFEVRVRNRGGWSLELHDCFYDRRFLSWKGRAHNHLSGKSKAPQIRLTLLARERLLVAHHTDMEKPRGYQLAGTALEALGAPGSERWGFFLGRELMARGYRHSALPILMALDRAEVRAGVRSAGLGLAARCLAGLGGSPDEVAGILFRAARRDSKRRDPLMRLALRCVAEGNMQGAASLALAALQIPAQAGISEPEENHSTGPHAVLYWALFWLGRVQEARPHFEVCRRLDPHNALYLEHARLFGPGPERTAKS